jgi:hypothetical protein
MILMTRFLSACIALLAMASCTEYSSAGKQYFKRGEMSNLAEQDSVVAKRYSAILAEVEEPPLRLTSSNVTALRFIMDNGFYNPIVVHVRHWDSVTSVIVKIGPDKVGRKYSGLSKFELHYESKSKQMDSIYRVLIDRVNRYDFYNAYDDPKDYDVADGSGYLLENFAEGEYRMVHCVGVGLNGRARFRGSDDFYAIARILFSYVPDHLLPDLPNAKTIDDLLFPVFKRRDSIQAASDRR